MKRIILVLALLVLSACVGRVTQDTAAATPVRLMEPVDFGNGVYYFQHVEGFDMENNPRVISFGKSLAAFLKTHDCKVEAITGDFAGVHQSRGAFVICR